MHFKFSPWIWFVHKITKSAVWEKNAWKRIFYYGFSSSFRRILNINRIAIKRSY
jgi:hypothetical protein